MGLHHFGFWVEDADSVRRKLTENGAEFREQRDPNDPAPAANSFFEEKYRGPDSVMIDISEHGWAGAQPPVEAAAARA
jgi:hypothetical protein